MPTADQLYGLAVICFVLAFLPQHPRVPVQWQWLACALIVLASFQ
jgi:hypothetical protein